MYYISDVIFEPKQHTSKTASSNLATTKAGFWWVQLIMQFYYK